MKKTIKLLVNQKDNNKRIDVFLSEIIKEFTRSYIKKLIERKNLIINGQVIKRPSTKIKVLDSIKFSLENKENNKLIPKKMKLNIIYEDKDILLINKPKGLVVHPGAGNYYDTLANGLAYKYKNKLSDINGDLRPGIVHRIDKETSGLLVTDFYGGSYNRTMFYDMTFYPKVNSSVDRSAYQGMICYNAYNSGNGGWNATSVGGTYNSSTDLSGGGLQIECNTSFDYVTMSLYGVKLA